MGCSVAFGCTLEVSCDAEVVGATVAIELLSGPEVVGCSVAFGCTLDSAFCEAKVVGCPVEIT